MVSIIAASVLLIAFASPLLGIIALVVSLYFDYNIYKFIRMQLKSYIETDEDGISCLTPSSDSVYIPWDNLTFAGTYSQGKSDGIYLYSENQDQLLIIPNEYSDLELLKDQLAEKHSLTHLLLEKRKPLREQVKEHLS